VSKVDPRKLKDQAAKAVEKRSYDKAAELYLQIAQLEPDEADWRQRAGEALRKTEDHAGAAAQFMLAAEGYAKAGFLLKAIAVCKVVLQIDPAHTATQDMLSSLYAQRDSRAPAGQVSLRPAPILARSLSGQLEVITPSATPPPPARPAPPPMPPPEPKTAAAGGAPISDELALLDEIDLSATPTLPVGAPMEVVPLATVLNGKKSGQFRVVLPEELDDGGEIDLEAAAYEISLADVIIDEAPPAADPMSLRVTPPPTPPPAPPPAPAVPLARLDDDLDFSGLVQDTAPPPPAAPPPVESSGPPPAAVLPRIPLLSSLTADRLRHVIERVEVRELPAGHEVVRQGERGGSLFIIVTGRVRIQVGARVVATMRDGDFFGEQAILTDFPRTATVVTEEPTQLLELSRALVSELVAGSPDVLRTLLRFFRDRLLERLLGTSALFASLSPDDAKALSERFVFLELEPKMRVVKEGERAPGLFLLLCGEVHVVKGQAKLAVLAPGDVFGEMSLLAGGVAMANIVTASKCWALELPRKDFQEIMVSYPQVLAYVSELAEKRAADNDRIELL
jgi:CRP-like cAMP-binding protein